MLADRERLLGGEHLPYPSALLARCACALHAEDVGELTRENRARQQDHIGVCTRCVSAGIGRRPLWD